jgi:hypothetical protein
MNLTCYCLNLPISNKSPLKWWVPLQSVLWCKTNQSGVRLILFKRTPTKGLEMKWNALFASKCTLTLFNSLASTFSAMAVWGFK